METTKQRYDRLLEIIGDRSKRNDTPYDVLFKQTRFEKLKGCKDTVRVHHSVEIINNTTHKTGVFSYFGPMKMKKGFGYNDYFEKPANPTEYSKDRLLSFFYCLVSDSQTFNSIRCPGDLESEGLTEGWEATEKLYMDLLTQSKQIDSIFSRTDWKQIEAIMEGY